MRKRLTREEAKEFNLVMKTAMSEVFTSNENIGFKPSEHAKRRRIVKKLKQAAKKTYVGGQSGELMSATGSDGSAHRRSNEIAAPDLDVLNLAREELLESCTTKTIVLWRQRLVAMLAGEAESGRKDQDWAILVTGDPMSNIGDYSERQVLEWASAVVCRFEVLARASKLASLVAMLDEQDGLATQLMTLEAMQGVRRTVAIAFFIFIITVPVDAEALHLLLQA